MKVSKILASVLFASLSFGAFAFETEYVADDFAYETDSILHEMQLACVATKSECMTLASKGGYKFLKVLKDAARCPQRAKPMACIVQH